MNKISLSNNKSYKSKIIGLGFLALASFYVGYMIGKTMALNGIKLCSILS